MAAKRNAVVVLSSDDEDVKSSSRSKSKPPLSRSGSKVPKKPRLSGSRSRSCKQSDTVDEFDFFGEDFRAVFTGVKVFTGFDKVTGKELWVDRYKPCTLEDLAVHKKKVGEVKAWFEQRLQAPKGQCSSNVLLITGQAGVGKSATVRVIASHLGTMLFEWSTPTPTIWQEHIYTSNTGTRYISKLDEFEFFIERIRKYGLVSSSLDGKSSSPVILLIDDLPLTFGRTAYKRLENCLYHLVLSACTPTVLLITDNAHSDSVDDTAQSLEKLQSFLEKAGAYKISFNPITDNSIKRTLCRICKQERRNVTATQLDVIAKSSGGDIRQAITSLQFLCFDKDALHPSSLSNSAPERNTPGDNSSVHFGRDETLSLFHALGKFLHNKRETESTSCLDALPIREKYSRLPLKMDSPEKVLCQAHGQARPIAEFLHENALDFLDDDAMDDAWVMLSYLCDADVLLDTSRRNFARDSDAESVLQSCAASVAVRGVLFGNNHPLPPRWHSIRKPKLWQVEKSSLRNKDELLMQRDEFHGSSDLSVIATEFEPVYRRIQREQPVHHGTVVGSGRGGGDEDTSMKDSEADASDSEDEIEEW